jgi:hypothetical protein
MKNLESFPRKNVNPEDSKPGREFSTPAQYGLFSGEIWIPAGAALGRNQMVMFV